MITVYIATAYTDAEYVEEVIRPMATERALTIVSRWHIDAHGPERLHDLPLPRIHYIAEQNDADLGVADAVLVLAHERMGETIAEMTRGLLAGKIVAYVGPRYILSAYRPGVARFSDPRDALTWIAGQKRRGAEPDFTAVFRPSSPPTVGPDTLRARADDDVERELGDLHDLAKLAAVVQAYGKARIAQSEAFEAWVALECPMGAPFDASNAAGRATWAVLDRLEALAVQLAGGDVERVCRGPDDAEVQP